MQCPRRGLLKEATPSLLSSSLANTMHSFIIFPIMAKHPMPICDSRNEGIHSWLEALGFGPSWIYAASIETADCLLSSFPSEESPALCTYSHLFTPEPTKTGQTPATRRSECPQSPQRAAISCPEISTGSLQHTSARRGDKPMLRWIRRRYGGSLSGVCRLWMI